MKFAIAVLLFSAVAAYAENSGIIYSIAGDSGPQSNISLYNWFESILPAMYAILQALQNILNTLGLGAFTATLTSFANSLDALIEKDGAHPGTFSLGFKQITGDIKISKN